MDSLLVQPSNPDSRAGRELEWCTGFCPALHTGWLSAVTYYDCTVKHIILAACEPWHGGLDSNPRYVVTHHPIHWRNSPLGIHGGAPYYQSFFLVTFCGIICWVRLDSSPELGFYKVKNVVLGSARHSALWDEFSKALHRWVKEKILPLKSPGICLDIWSWRCMWRLCWVCEEKHLAKLTPWCKHEVSLVTDKIK